MLIKTLIAIVAAFTLAACGTEERGHATAPKATTTTAASLSEADLATAADELGQWLIADLGELTQPLAPLACPKAAGEQKLEFLAEAVTGSGREVARSSGRLPLRVCTAPVPGATPDLQAVRIQNVSSVPVRLQIPSDSERLAVLDPGAIADYDIADIPGDGAHYALDFDVDIQTAAFLVVRDYFEPGCAGLLRVGSGRPLDVL